MNRPSLVLVGLILVACAPDRQTTQPPAKLDLEEVQATIADQIAAVRTQYGPAARAAMPEFSVTSVGGGMTESDVVALLEANGFEFAGKGENEKLRVRVPENRIPRDPKTGEPLAGCFSLDRDLNSLARTSWKVFSTFASVFRPTPLAAATVQGCGCDSQCWIDGWVGTCYLDTFCGSTQVCAFVFCTSGTFDDPLVPAVPGTDYDLIAYDCQPW